MKRLTLPALALTLLALVAACGVDTKGANPGGEPGGTGDGTLAGTITIGPLCPIEPCDHPTGSPYYGMELVLQPPGGVRIAIPVNTDGTCAADVPAGTYTAHLTNCVHLGFDTAFPRPADGDPTQMTAVAGQTSTYDFDIDTGIRAPVAGSGIAAVMQRLRDAGATVEAGSFTSQPLFSTPGQVLVVNGHDVQLCAYDDAARAQAEAATISPDATTIGTTSVMWAKPASFYLRDAAIALYVGTDPGMISLLNDTFGEPVGTGIGVSHEPPEPDLPTAADDAARAALAARLGIAPGAAQLVYSSYREFPNLALGCRQPGAAYGQAIVPGFSLLYEHDRLLYQYNVSEDGGQLTDCIGEGAEALPFRLGRGIVSTLDAFELVERQGSLAAEIVLRTEDASMDWDTQLLAGVVAKGTGCTFVLDITGTRLDHASKSFAIGVSAIAEGLCEKFSAEARWVIVEGVPDDYRVGFLLNSTSDLSA
jgi:hypothetical protein